MRIEDLKQPDKWNHLKRTLRRYVADVVERIRGVDFRAMAALFEVKGIDVSYWQGAILDPEKLARSVDFILIRAGFGNDWVDTRLEQFREFCHKYKKPFGLYWYVKPGKNAEKHAGSFYGVWIIDPGEIYPTFDVEEDGGLQKTALESWLWKMYQHASYGFITLARITLEKVMTYTSPGFLNRAIGLTNWLKNTLPFIAHWTNADEPIMPNEWSDINNPRPWKFWQWRSTGDAKAIGLSSRYVDEVRYNGTRKEFEAEFGVVLDPVEPPDEEVEVRYRVIADGLRIRDAANTVSNIIGVREVGEIVTILEIAEDPVYPCGTWVRDERGWSAAIFYNPPQCLMEPFT